jgi:polysaccharide export outer membrane protein
VVNSPYYYLKQNDVVYVEPTEVKKGQSEYNQNNSYKVSVVSAIVSGCSVVVSLLIALLVK